MTGRRRYKSAKHSGLAKENKRGGEDQLRRPHKKQSNRSSINPVATQSILPPMFLFRNL